MIENLKKVKSNSALSCERTSLVISLMKNFNMAASSLGRRGMFFRLSLFGKLRDSNAPVQSAGGPFCEIFQPTTQPAKTESTCMSTSRFETILT